MTAVEKILKLAASQVGVKEVPAGSNTVKYNTWYYGREVSGTAYPWCCAFVAWIFHTCGLSHLFYGGEKTAYCPTVETYYKSKKQWHTKNPKVGDLVLYDFYGKGIAGHIGILEKINADGTYIVIEGNTSLSNNDNGGAVMRRVRNKSVIRGFARPNYDSTKTIQTKKEENTVDITLHVLEKGSEGNEVKTLQRLLISLGYSCGKSGIDGDFGTATDKAVKKFQTDKGLEVDGVVGKNTWTALLK